MLTVRDVMSPFSSNATSPWNVFTLASAIAARIAARVTGPVFATRSSASAITITPS